jgi:anti-anti-sigma regulatory factor
MNRIDVDRKTAVITLDKALTSASGEELFSLTRALDTGVPKILVLDFGCVELLDNTGINVLVKLHAYARKTHSRILVTGLNDLYKNVFAVSGLNEGFHICIAEEDIIRAGNIKDSQSMRMLSGLLTKVDSQKIDGAECWAKPVDKLIVEGLSDKAINLNVHGRRTVGPIQGFGQLWEKTYVIDLSDTNLKPEQIISTLKQRFPEFQPPENRFFPSPRGIAPGEVVLINASTPGGLVATGIVVLYVGKDTFTFITPQGHPEAGWVTFKSFEEHGRIILQIQGMARASDPVYEMAFRMAGSTLQRQIWTHVLESFARHTGSNEGVQFNAQCLDRSLQWSRLFNVFLNAQVTSMLYNISHPAREK